MTDEGGYESFVTVSGAPSSHYDKALTIGKAYVSREDGTIVES